jgi:hypothetical protein
VKDSLIATKDEQLASRAAEGGHRIDKTTAGCSKRSRLYDNSVPPLARYDVLDHVFSFVGGGDHLYTGGVSRKWRGRYMQYCAQHSTSKFDRKLVTSNRSVLMTACRLRLALTSGLCVENWAITYWYQAELICMDSLEPEKVLALLRVHGVAWSTVLCNVAAYYNDLPLLQWLRVHSCPWDTDGVLYSASAGGSIAVLEWLFNVIAPWSPDVKLCMLIDAAKENKLTAVQWLRKHGAKWPPAFSVMETHNGHRERTCWPLSAVQWALACGSGWLEWKCEHYAADKYQHVKFRQHAAELLEWAHANGCPCTCEHV